MNIEDLTLKDIRGLLAEAGRIGLLDAPMAAALPVAQLLPGTDAWPFLAGTVLLVQTVTHYYTGSLVSVDLHSIVLDEAAWIPDTGRFSNAIATGIVAECEPLPNGPFFIARGAVVSACKFGAAKAPREVK